MFDLDTNKLKTSRRTIKTSLAVGICILLFHLFGRGTPMLACLAAVFAMREDTSTTFYFGIRRVLASILAGFLAVLLASLKLDIEWKFLIDLFGVMFAVIIFIALCNFFDLSEAIIGGLAAFLIIYFNIPANENIVYATQLFLDTLIGILIATGVDWMFHQRTIHKKSV